MSVIATTAMTTELFFPPETANPCQAADTSTTTESVSESVTKTLRSLSFSESMIVSIIEEITAHKKTGKANTGVDDGEHSKGVSDVSLQKSPRLEDSEVINSPFKSSREDEQVETSLEPNIVDLHVRQNDEPPIIGLQEIDVKSGSIDTKLSDNIVYFIEMDEHIADKEIEIHQRRRRVERLKAKVNQILAKTRPRSGISASQVRANLARSIQNKKRNFALTFSRRGQ